MLRSKISPLVLVLALSSAGLSACGSSDTPEQAVAFKGETLTVAPKVITDMKPLAATLTTRQMSEATARVSGILTALKVREGDVVTQGQIIGFVQDQKLSLQTGAYDQAAVAAEAQASLARAALGRTQTLFNKGIYAQAKLDQDKAAAAAADANVRAARAQAAASGEGARQGAILSPGSGRVIHATVPVGSVVMAGQSVATITAGNRVVRIELPEGQGRTLSIGQSITLDSNGTRATGTITEIYPSVTAGQILADVTAVGLDDVAIGQTVVAYVGVGQRKAVIVPKRFIVTRYGLDYVRIVQKTGSVLETTVQTAPTADPDEIEVLGGLTAGDRVAAYGIAK